jgi:hypothetical protein
MRLGTCQQQEVEQNHHTASHSLYRRLHLHPNFGRTHTSSKAQARTLTHSQGQAMARSPLKLGHALANQLEAVLATRTATCRSKVWQMLKLKPNTGAPHTGQW